MSGQVIELDTPLGAARLFASMPPSGRPHRAVLLLGHGAGGGVDAPDLVALTGLAERGIVVLRYEQPWRTAGKRVAPAPARLDEGWVPAMAYATTHFPDLPLVIGGRSAGARVAARCAASEPVAGMVGLAFPLHPPGRPEKSRAHELLGAACPVLVLQGERDPFGHPGEVAGVADAAGVDNIEVVLVADCGHEFTPPTRAAATPELVAAVLSAGVEDFLARITPGE